MTGTNPLDWYGPEFLTLYGVLFVAALIASFWIAAKLRPDGQRGSLTDPDELAVLARGKDRLAEVVAARLLERRALKLEKGRLMRIASTGGVNAVDSQVLSLPERIRWRDLRRVTDVAAGSIKHHLIGRGLLMDTGDWLRLGLLAVIPLLLVLGLGLAKLSVGLARDRPVMFLIFFLIITAATILARWTGTDRRTRAGLTARDDALEQNARLSDSHTRDETSMAVALFGTGVLSATPFAALHDWRRTNEGGGNDNSSSGGDGGGGGSGCGGCGS